MTCAAAMHEEPAMTQHHGRLLISMGIIKRTAELTRELSNARNGALNRSLWAVNS